MNEHTCLLQALVDDPFDDLSKLAYADWLEERENFSSGSPRLRLQAEWLGLFRAGPNADPARYLELRTQLREPQAEPLSMWDGVGDLPPLVGDILHWSSRYDCTKNTFLVITWETSRTVLVAGLPTKLIMNACCGQMGTQRPILPGLEELRTLYATKSGFRLRKDPPGPDGSRSFTRGHQRFRIWDGQDKWFDSD